MSESLKTGLGVVGVTVGVLVGLFSGILLLVVFLALIPAFVARSKGHNFAAWWAFGIWLFVVALPVSLLMRPDYDRQEERTLAEGRRSCPHCAEWIRQEAKVCRYCGRDVPLFEGSPGLGRWQTRDYRRPSI